MSNALHLRLVAWVGFRTLALLAMAALPAMAAERITVAQLEQAVADVRAVPDNDAAKRLAPLELAQRLTRARYDRLRACLPGENSRLALLALADAAAFLPLPKEDILNIPPPDTATQGRIVSQAADFVVASVSRMPDFYASRTTTRFQDLAADATPDAAMHATAPNAGPESTSAPGGLNEHGVAMKDRRTETVTFRNGREVVEATLKGIPAGSAGRESGLADWGVFGPLLGIVMTDVMKNRIGWGHWEQGPAGPLAVFRYAVQKERSNYTVHYCCIVSEEGELREFVAGPAYHGEVAIDPASGAVLRLVIKTDLLPLAEETLEPLPIERLDVQVEYGSVDIGGRACICPIQSTTILRARAAIPPRQALDLDRSETAGGHPGNSGKAARSSGLPKITAINDVVFNDYHQFRGELRILPAESSEKDGNEPAPVATSGPKPPPTR